MKILNALAAASMLCATPVGAIGQDESHGPVEYGSSGAWTVYAGKSDCSMLASYESNNRLIMQFDQRLGILRVSFSDTATKALKSGDKRKLLVVFVEPGYDDVWGEHDFTVAVIDGKTYFAAGFDADDMLKDFAKYQTIGFLYKDNIVRSLSLIGSSAAIVKLRECATRQAKANPSDLFAE